MLRQLPGPRPSRSPSSQPKLRASPTMPVPNDKTLGLEASRRAPRSCIGRLDLEPWAKGDGKTTGRVARSSTASPPSATGNMQNQAEKFGDFQTPPRIQGPPHARRRRGRTGATAASISRGTTSSRSSTPTSLKPQEQRLRRDLRADRPGRERLQAAAPAGRPTTSPSTPPNAKATRSSRRPTSPSIQNGLTIIDDKEISLTKGGVGNIKEGRRRPDHAPGPREHRPVPQRLDQDAPLINPESSETTRKGPGRSVVPDPSCLSRAMRASAQCPASLIFSPASFDLVADGGGRLGGLVGGLIGRFLRPCRRACSAPSLSAVESRP